MGLFLKRNKKNRYYHQDPAISTGPHGQVACRSRTVVPEERNDATVQRGKVVEEIHITHATLLRLLERGVSQEDLAYGGTSKELTCVCSPLCTVGCRSPQELSTVKH